MSDVRTRIAPSPTGFFHIGSARTTLFNYLFAKKCGGRFVLRIEDTDLQRSDSKFEIDIFESIRWLGIQADESPEVGGPFGPYRQSERLDSYKSCLKKLLANGSAFWCSCPVEEEVTDTPSVFWCQFSGKSERHDTNQSKGIIRFRNPYREQFEYRGSIETIGFVDLIRGPIQFDASLLGDFSLAKNLDTPLYNFAVVIDDFKMEVSHVIRGEDHIPNTPKQFLIAKALGWARKDEIGNDKTPWEYAHLPLILGPDRSKLSKRHGAVSVSEYRRLGYLPEALVNFMALLGWNPGTNQEIFRLDELIEAFTVEKIQKSGAIFDITKLDWMNGEYIRRKSIQELTDMIEPFLVASIPEASSANRQKIEAIVALEQPRLKKLAEIGERVDFYFQEPKMTRDLLQWKSMSTEEISMALDESIKLLQNLEDENPTKESLEAVFLPAAEAHGDRGLLLWPLRMALTGKKASPGPFDIIPILGKMTSVGRLESAKTIL